nr:hypothetical protein Iba_chr14cCG16090 [Ipomoea batatas]
MNGISVGSSAKVCLRVCTGLFICGSVVKISSDLRCHTSNLIEFAGSSNTSLGRIHADSDIQKFPGVQIVGSNYGAIYLGGWSFFMY